MSLPYSPILVTKSKFFTVESLIEVLLQKTVMDTKRGIQVYICWKLTYVCILCRLKMPRSLQGKDHAISARLEFFLDKEISLWSFLTWLWRHGERGKVWQLCCLYRPLVRNSSSMVPIKKDIFNIQMHHEIPDLDLTFLSTDVQNVIVFFDKRPEIKVYILVNWMDYTQSSAFNKHVRRAFPLFSDSVPWKKQSRKYFTH